MKRSRVRALSLLFLCFCAAGSYLVIKAFKQPSAADQHTPTSPSTRASIPSTHPAPKIDSYLLNKDQTTVRLEDEDVRAQKAINAILNTKAGRLTSSDVNKILEDVKIYAENYRRAIRNLLDSENPQERILGTFMHAKTFGYDDKLLSGAMSDHSPFVIAEMAMILLENQEFELFKAFIKGAGEKLTKDQIDLMKKSVHDSPPHMMVSVGMDLLEIGQGLPILFRYLALANQDLQTFLVSILENPESSMHTTRFALESLAAVQPSEYRQVLINSINLTEHKGFRDNLLIEYLAATSSMHDFETREFIAQSVSPVPRGLTRKPILYREDKIDAITKIAGEISSSSRDKDANANQIYLAGNLEHLHSLLVATPLDRDSPAMKELIKIQLDSKYLSRRHRIMIAEIFFKSQSSRQ